MASIAEIDGLTIPSGAAFTGLLDTYTGAAAGYSTRRLASSATNLMRIREDAGDTETDIGYDSNGDLDTAAIATHCGTANGFVVSWVDQSGNANDADQSTLASQPQIYDGTAVITDNGKPAVKGSDIVNTVQLRTASFTGDSGAVSVFAVRNCTASSNTEGVIIDHSTQLSFGGSDGFRLDCYNNTNRFGTNSNFTQSSLTTPTGQELQSGVANSSGRTLYIDGSSVASTSGDQTTTGAANRPLTLFGAFYSNQLPFRGTIQEVVLYTGTSNGDQSSNRSDIETNINSEYLIYQPTAAPTSGLLATYTGAAAAYSVRQLANTAVMSMRVRRDSDDVEQNFGFDSNGDLDTAGIASFCGTANGYVSRWWDQSTNGNHADQATDASQPQIYNGTAVITDNGKPALEFNQDGFAPITGSKSDILFHTSTQGMLYNVGNYTASQNALRIIAETNGTSSNKSGFVFGYDDRAATGGSDYGYYSLTKATGSANAITGTQEASFVGAQYLMAIHYDFASGIFQYQNGSLLDSQTGSKAYGTGDATNDLSVGSSAGFVTLIGKMQELVLYNDDDTNRSGIETNINTYFSIY
jgi:hypothetical protein